MWKSYDVAELVNIPRFYTIFSRHRENEYSFEGETHNFWECLYILNGKLRVTSDERVYVLEGGNLVFHKPLELHKYDVLSENGADILVFSFDMEGEICDFFEGKVIRLNLRQKELVADISSHIDSLRQNGVKKEKHTIELLEEHPILMQEIAEEIKVLFLQVYSDHKTAKLYENKDSIIFKNLVSYMKENIKDNVMVKDLSERFYISESTIKRIFKKNAGIGVHAYFLRLKIAEASKYLKISHSVNETAQEFNFKNISYFSTVFKREIGVTPTEYLNYTEHTKSS